MHTKVSGTREKPRVGRGPEREGQVSCTLCSVSPSYSRRSLNTSKMPPDLRTRSGLEIQLCNKRAGRPAPVAQPSGPCASSYVMRCLSGFFQACPSMWPKLRRDMGIVFGDSVYASSLIIFRYLDKIPSLSASVSWSGKWAT